MSEPGPITRRRFLQTTVAFSAAASVAGAGGLVGCGSGIRAGVADSVVDEPSHFLMVGDWGATSPTAQTVVSKAMQAYVAKHAFTTDALMMLGDNFYGNMPGGADSPRWQTQFEEMYPASVFPGPAYAVPGNHDYQNAPQSKYAAQLAYAAAGNTRWSMPGRYRRWTFPEDNPAVTFIALDSNMPNEKAQPIPPDASYYTQSDADRQTQLTWLEGALAQPQGTPFLVVIAHHPVYSNGAHGDNATLIRDWDPLFRKYKVDLYLAGHDHDLQHLEFAGHPTSFVSSGGGGAELSPLTSSKYGPYGSAIHGFTHLQVNQELMTIRHVDENGNLQHKFTRDPGGTVTILK